MPVCFLFEALKLHKASPAHHQRNVLMYVAMCNAQLTVPFYGAMGGNGQISGEVCLPQLSFLHRNKVTQKHNMDFNDFYTKI